MAAATLRRLATAPRAGATAFTLGLMYARQQDAIARARKQFPAIWSEASKPTYRKWLRA